MDGIIIINKEKNYTSNDVVQIVKKIFKEKVGHTGTLDPMATGVLPLLVGKGTLVSKYLINHDKTYIAKLKLGIRTDTADITGNVIEKREVQIDLLDNDKIKSVLKSFIGKQKQTPPMYSAIKINGKKLYEYARNGQQVEVASKEIIIYDIELISINRQNNEIEFRVDCSKGTYIRTLCEDIASLLGTIGTMSALNRERVGEFTLKNAITIEKLKSNFENSEFIDKNFISLEKIFKKKNKIVLTPRSYIGFINGVKLFTDEPSDVYRVYDVNNCFVGLGVVKDGILKREIVIEK